MRRSEISLAQSAKGMSLVLHELGSDPDQTIATRTEQLTGGGKKAAALARHQRRTQDGNTHLLVELSNGVLGTILERSHF